MNGRRRSTARQWLDRIRDGWSILGITLLLFLSLELAYRGQAAVRAKLRQSTPAAATPRNPQANEPWFRSLLAAESREGGGRRFDPYRSWWPLPLSSPHLNVDSLGRRATLQAYQTAEPRIRVFTFGGSTMWGWTTRDAGTIPSKLASALRERGRTDVEVTNYAQSAYTLTQGVITLMLEVRGGSIPDVAVFLDGGNEVATAWASGRAGAITNESLAANAFVLGRRGFWQELIGVGRHSALVRRLGGALGTQPATAARPSPELCSDVAAYYANLTRIATAIGDAFGFDVVFFGQPLLTTSRKSRTAWESSRKAPDEFLTLQRTCAARTDLIMAGTGVNYLSLHPLFDGDSGSMFTDHSGHLTEAANARVAGAIAQRIAPLLQRRDPLP